MERCLYAFDYVDLKNKEYERRHTKPRYLGDVDGRYRFRPRSCTPTLVGSLVNLELPETRALNTTGARDIIANQTRQIQGTYEKSNRQATLDAWSYPPLFQENQHDEGELLRRPHTAAGVHDRPQSGRSVAHQVLRPFSTGSPGQRVHPNAPAQHQRYMTAKLKRRHSGSNTSIGKNVTLRTVTGTTSLQAQWEEEDRNEQQSPRRVKSQNAKRFDSFAGQWLSFAGGTEHDDMSSGVLDAFTGEAADEYYNVESRIGANIALQLNKGNKIRVGKNGTLQSNSLKVHKWKNEVNNTRRSRDSCSTVGSWDKPVVKQVVPLSWDDQLAEPDAKVVDVVEKQAPPPKPDLCERHPVVYEKLVKEDNPPRHKVKLHVNKGYQVRQSTKNKRNIDGTESLNNRITMISVDDVKEDRDSMCSEEYEELLHRSLQTADLNQNEILQFSKNELENAKTIRDDFALSISPPAPSLNESRESFVTDNNSDDHTRQSSIDVNLTRINLNPDDLMTNNEMPRRQMSAALSARQRSATSGPRQRSAASAHRSANAPPSPRHLARPGTGVPLMSARTRSQTPQTEQPPKRAQSSPPRRKKHYFDEPPTHSRVKSPRPILAKPGQLPRSGVASIRPNSSTHDGDQEYIKISHQLLPSSQSTSRIYSATSRASDKPQSELPTVLDTASDTASIDSMDVNKGDQQHHHHDDHGHERCTCSPEAKRVLSAALSTHLSNVSDPSGVINIPTAGGLQLDLDQQSKHDSEDVASFYSEKSDPLDGLDTPLDSGRQSPELDPPIGEDHEGLVMDKPADQMNNDANQQEMSPKEDIFINTTDGLSFDQKDMEQLSDEHNKPKSRVVSPAKPKRTVKFADEQEDGSLSPSVPQCTPSSTPRDPTSDTENG